jgi:hypothetical protein
VEKGIFSFKIGPGGGDGVDGGTIAYRTGGGGGGGIIFVKTEPECEGVSNI